MKRNYKRRRQAKKAEVLAALASNGGNVKRTARETGVSESTIRNWKKDPDGAAAPELINTKRLSLAAKLMRMSFRYAEELEKEEVIKATPPRDIAVTLGILLTKVQELLGKPTSVSEVRVVVEDYDESRHGPDAPVRPPG